jgi:hypothetical protein
MNNRTETRDMKNKYTVSIWPANPSQQYQEEYDSKADAIHAARQYLGEELEDGQSASEITIERNGERIAAATATDKRLTWL